MIDECLLTEIELHGGKFTWEMSQGKSEWVKEKLDMCFATQSWINLFPLSKLTVFPSDASDHDPIFLDLLNVSFSKKVFHFRFENTWLRDPDFRKKLLIFVLSFLL